MPRRSPARLGDLCGRPMIPERSPGNEARSIHRPVAPRVRSRGREDLNRRLLRARDRMDRSYAEALDVGAVSAVAHLSEAHFSRTFRVVFGETPHRYLQRRRLERSMFLLRETDRNVASICRDVGFNSLGTFSRTFRAIVGETPAGYRAAHGPMLAPNCIQKAAMRPIGGGWDCRSTSRPRNPVERQAAHRHEPNSE